MFCSSLLGADLQHTMRRRASVEMGRGTLRVQRTPGAGSSARGRRADEGQRSQMTAQRRRLLLSRAMQRDQSVIVRQPLAFSKGAVICRDVRTHITPWRTRMHEPYLARSIKTT